MIASIRSSEPELATVEELCLTLEVSRSGFYAHKTKHLRPRRIQDAILSEEIRQAFERSRNTYGTVRLRCDLRDRGHHCGRRRIARLMKKNGLEPVRKCRFVPKTTDSTHGAEGISAASPKRAGTDPTTRGVGD